MKLTKKEAKKLSILKWEFIIANGGDHNNNKLPKELDELISHCGYCEKYEQYCLECPLYLGDDTDGNGCASDTHPWSIWYYNSTVENAQAMLDLILKT